jgi:hypothetical protein
MFNFFRKKKVKFLGRGGVIFRYQNNDYFIDSEMSFSKDIDIVLFKESIRLKDRNESLSETQKKEILDHLLDYLKNKEHLRVELSPK